MSDTPVIAHGTKPETPDRDRVGERYRLAVRATHDAIFDLDLVNDEVQTNAAHDAMLGVPPAGESGMQWWRGLLHTDDRDRVLDSLKAAIDGTSDAWQCEYRLRRIDGSWATIFDRAYIVRDQQSGKAVRIIGSMLDLTERRKSEEALRRSEELFRAVMTTTEFAIYVKDMESRMVYINPATERIIGKSAAEVLGRTDREFYTDPAIGDAIIEHDRRITTAGVPVGFEEVVETPAGLRTMLSSKVPWRDGAGNIIGLIGISRDITERKQAEKAQRESEEKLQLLAWTADRLLSAPDPQAFVEELCRRVMPHLDCDIFFNFLADEEEGRLHLNASGGAPDDVVREMQRLDYGVAVCGSVARSRQRIVAEDISHSDDPRTALVRSFGVQAYCCHPILAQGRLLGTLSFGTRTRPRFTEQEVELMRTVTDQVAAAMQRVLSEKAQREFSLTLERRVADRTAEVQSLVVRLRELALELTEAELRERRRVARILHDHFQQVLVAAKLQVDVLLSRVRAEQLRESAREADQLLTEAIQAARTLAVELCPPVLHEAGLLAGLEWLRERMKQQHRLQVHLAADADVDPGSDDIRAFIYESVRELLFNVVKHAGVREARLAVHRGYRDIEVIVEDGGAGLVPIADPAKEKGSSGSGLFSIGQRVESLGGSLSFEKVDGRGTRVKLRIPVTPLAEPTVSASSTPAKAARSGRAQDRIRVLLVDDHRIVRQGFAALLRSDEELDVVGEAADGEEAIELARLLRPDVVVMDVSMPKMGGIDATRWLAANLSRVRVIGLSMHEDEPVAAAMREAGAVAFVTKDGPSAALIAAIHAARPGQVRQAERE